MEKRDTRSLGKEVQQANRYQFIRLRKQGEKNKDIAVFLGISAQHTSTIWQKYLKGGRNDVTLGVRGPRHGEKRTLTEEQEREIKRLITNQQGFCHAQIPAMDHILAAVVFSFVPA